MDLSSAKPARGGAGPARDPGGRQPAIGGRTRLTPRHRRVPPLPDHDAVGLSTAYRVCFTDGRLSHKGTIEFELKVVPSTDVSCRGDRYGRLPRAGSVLVAFGPEKREERVDDEVRRVHFVQPPIRPGTGHGPAVTDAALRVTVVSGRSLRVFRDDTDLSSAGGLSTSIQAALQESRWFVLIASPSGWVTPAWGCRRTGPHWSLCLSRSDSTTRARRSCGTSATPGASSTPAGRSAGILPPMTGSITSAARLRRVSPANARWS